MNGVTGVLGQPWRADVTTHGALEPWDGSPPLDWHVAADDRWHSPASEVAVRQQRLLGAPVFETRLRVPGGDAVHRLWSVPDHGGLTIVDVENDSPLPIACALTRDHLRTTRPPADVPVVGIELPPTTTVLPIGHRASARVALAHAGRADGRLPADLPSAEAVARGWVAASERASRLDLPSAVLQEAVVTARCALLLAGPSDRAEDPVGYLLGVGELVRLREAVGDVVADVASAAEELARVPGWEADAALAAAARVLAVAGEGRAVADLARIIDRRMAAQPPPATADGVRAVAAVEGRLLRGGVLFPDGYPPEWRGADLEAHGLPAGPETTVSFAVRWHGQHPAVLWQVEGRPVVLSAPAVDPSWRAEGSSGEALWRTAIS